MYVPMYMNLNRRKMSFILKDFCGCIFLFLFVVFGHLIHASDIQKMEIIRTTKLSSHAFVRMDAKTSLSWCGGALITRKTVLTSGTCAYYGKLAVKVLVVIGKEVIQLDFPNANEINYSMGHDKMKNNHWKYNIGLFISNNNLVEDRTILAQISNKGDSIDVDTKVAFNSYNLTTKPITFKILNRIQKVVKCTKSDETTDRSICVHKPNNEVFYGNDGGPIYAEEENTVISITYYGAHYSGIDTVITIATGASGVYNWIKLHQKN